MKTTLQAVGRKCQYCNQPLPTDSHFSKRFCNAECCWRKEYQKREIRRQQKELAAGQILDPETPVTLYNYKEPLKDFVDENGIRGFGYAGTLASNIEGTHVQCHFCGYLYKYLPAHIWHKHKLNAKQYKEAVGLQQKTALVSEQYRVQLIKNYQKLPLKHHNKVKENFNKYNEEVKNGEKKSGGDLKRNSPWSLEKRNKMGMCPDQLLHKIKELGDELGHTPSSNEFRKKHTRYATAILMMFGSWNAAIIQAGLTPNYGIGFPQYTSIQLLQYLRNFYKEHKRTPVHSDFSRGYLPSLATYGKRFGTLNEARLQAGIPRLIQISKMKYVEEKLDYLVAEQS